MNKKKNEVEKIREDLKKISRWPWDFLSKFRVYRDKESGFDLSIESWETPRVRNFKIAARDASDQQETDFYFIAKGPERLSQLLDALDKAEEVIKFYADKENWQRIKWNIDEYDSIRFEDMEDCHHRRYGGKKARKYFEEKE